MRLGFVGPSRGNIVLLREVAEQLLFGQQVQRLIYLGADDALDRAARGWPEHLGAPGDEAGFLETAASLACSGGSADELDALLERDRRLHRLSDIVALPPPPSRAIEMIDDRVVLMVFDKAVLDEDDVANASIIVWGNSQDPVVRPIGPRMFFSPGWITAPTGPHGGVLTHTEAALEFTLMNPAGVIVQSHRMPLTRSVRMGVQST